MVKLPWRDSAGSECRHESEGMRDYENDSIWHLEDSYLKDRRYWSERDAAFVELRERVNEYRCFGCGEEHTITTGEMTGEVRWKDDMDAEVLAHMRRRVNCGSYYNGQLWWESEVWGGDEENVATDFDRAVHQ